VFEISQRISESTPQRGEPTSSEQKKDNRKNYDHVRGLKQFCEHRIQSSFRQARVAEANLEQASKPTY